MKNKFIFLVGFIGIVVLVFAYFAVYGPSENIVELAIPAPQLQDIERIKSESQSPVQFYFTESGFPRGVLATIEVSGNNDIERARNFLGGYSDLYLQTSPALDLEVRRVSIDENGSSLTFYQVYKGLPVYAGELVVIIQNEKVTGTVGGLLTQRVEMDTTPSITDRQAVNLAKELLSLPEAVVLGQTTLMLFDGSLLEDVASEPHLVWRITLGGGEPVEVLIDAHDGALVNLASKVEEHYDGVDIDLEDANYTMVDSNCFGWPSDTADEIGSEQGVYEEAQNDSIAKKVWNYSLSTWGFYHNTFGRHSYDNDNESVEIYIHAMGKWASGKSLNAAYDPICDLFLFDDNYVAYDIFVHEYTHAVIASTSQLANVGQARILNEMYADIMAAIADGNWTMGEDSAGGANRTLPPQPGLPDHMDKFVPGKLYENIGIPGMAAYLLANGGTYAFPIKGYDTGQPDITISPLSLDTVAKLYYKTMQLLPEGAWFSDSRNLTVLVAYQYGLTEEIVCQIRNAFFVVGIGNPDVNCDGIEDIDSDYDGVYDPNDVCPGYPDWYCVFVDSDLDGISNALETKLADPCVACGFVPACSIGDLDGDSIIDDSDNCICAPNSNQADADNDGEGDACDPDTDGDGISNNDDNCPFTLNADQKDADNDLIGDACDLCPNTWESAVWHTGNPELGVDPYPIQKDSDNDGAPDACDSNVIVDGIAWYQKLAGLLDGQSHRAVVNEIGDSALKLPLPSCSQDDPDFYSPDYRGLMLFENPRDGFRAVIVDDEGNTVAKARNVLAGLSLPLQPNGGTEYFVQIFPMEEGSTEETISFEFSFTCGLVEPAAQVDETAQDGLQQDSVLVAIPLRNLNCRYYCTTESDIADTLLEGFQYEPIGWDPITGYFAFNGPAYGELCFAPPQSFETELMSLSIDDEALSIDQITNEMVETMACPAFPTPTSTVDVDEGDNNLDEGEKATPMPEHSQCSDGVDNDGDGAIDMADRQCRNADDNDETNP